MERDKLSAFIDELEEATRPLEATEFVELLRPLLDRRQIAPLVEYVAGRLGLDDGHRHVRFEFENGNLHKTRFGHEPVGNVELEGLARTR